MEVASFGRCTVLLSFPLSMYFMARQISGYRPATVRGLSGIDTCPKGFPEGHQPYPPIALG